MVSTRAAPGSSMAPRIFGGATVSNGGGGGVCITPLVCCCFFGEPAYVHTQLLGATVDCGTHNFWGPPGWEPSFWPARARTIILMLVVVAHVCAGAGPKKKGSSPPAVPKNCVCATVAPNNYCVCTPQQHPAFCGPKKIMPCVYAHRPPKNVCVCTVHRGPIVCERI